MFIRIILLGIVLSIWHIYAQQPVFALGFIDWSDVAILWGIILVAASLSMLSGNLRQVLMQAQWGELVRRLLAFLFPQKFKVVNISEYQHIPYAGFYKKTALAGLLLLLLGLGNLLVFPVITSMPILFNQSYRQLLGPVAESSFTADIEPINLGQIRIVDEEMARKLADKKIGEVPALGSEVQLGELVLQKVKQQLYYIAPLEHRGFFQWWTNRQQGSKGYIMVSATNPQDVRLVQQLDGQDVFIKYQLQGFVFDYLPRYVYWHGIMNIGMTDYSFEVDDDLNPYWVITLYTNKVGYRGSDAVGAVLVNARTGELTRYTMEDLPAWVDRVQPDQFVYKQISDWGEYVNGFWNAVLAKTGTLRPTSRDMHLIYGNDDRVYWYTGITSSGKDESTVGFMLIDSRSKEAKWYKIAGADEAGAKKSAEGQVQEKGYRAGYPILYNINGIPTYIAPLKDKEGLLKAVAFISVENYNLVGVGSDIESALRSYQQNIAGRGNLFVPQNESRQTTVSGVIERISPVVKSGDSYYYFMLAGDKRVFIGSVNTSPKLPLAKPGDQVSVTINESQEAVQTILEFKQTTY